jgi:hypothetical protein
MKHPGGIVNTLNSLRANVLVSACYDNTCLVWLKYQEPLTYDYGGNRLNKQTEDNYEYI